MRTTGRTIARTGVRLLVPIALIVVAAPVRGGPPAGPTPRAPPPPPTAPPAGPRPGGAAPLSVPATTASEFVVKRVLTVSEPIRLGDWYWDDAGVPAGPMVITADIQAGTLSVFRGGYEIGTAAILYGADDKPTPLGRFPITQKDADHWSNLYDAPMPYMLRLTGDGVSIHGSEVRVGKGTNGCIGVPVPFAKRLFAAVKVGDPVIVTNGRIIGLGGALRAG